MGKRNTISGVHITQSRKFRCSLNHAKQSFYRSINAIFRSIKWYRSINAIFGKIGRTASHVLRILRVTGIALTTLTSKGIRAEACTRCGLRWATVFTLVTCSTKSYVVRMLKLSVAHFTAMLCNNVSRINTTLPIRNRYRFRRSILTKEVINSGFFGPIVTVLTGTEEDNICWTMVTKSW